MKTDTHTVDPEIEEIHVHRRELLRQAGGSIETLGAQLRAQQAQYTERMDFTRQLPLPDQTLFQSATPVKKG